MKRTIEPGVLADYLKQEAKEEEKYKKQYKNQLRIFKQLKYNPVTLSVAADEYFQKQVENKKPITMSGLCNHLKLTVSRFSEAYASKPEFKEIVEMIKQRVLQYTEESLFELKNVQGAMFVLGNRFRWEVNKGKDYEGGSKVIVQIAPELINKYSKSPLLVENTAQDENGKNHFTLPEKEEEEKED